MFTGIIEGVGTVYTVKKQGEARQLEIECDFDLERINVGDSISVNGCCLTVTSRLGKRFWCDISPETCQVTTIGKTKSGDPVNIELSRKIGSRLDGHIVQGHVDGQGRIFELRQGSGAIELGIELPDSLARYVVEKGSIAVDGVSLTANHVENNRFFVSIIPHTKLKTTFSTLKAGDSVNLEVDIIGKYVEKLAFLDSDEYKKRSKITEEFLKKHGF